MRIPPRNRIARISALGALSAALFIGGPAALAAQATDATGAHHTAVSVQHSTAKLAKTGDICKSKLPSQADDTLKLIDAGGPYPYPQDDTVFDNREGILPDQSDGYYHEFTVKTPGSPDRGARRIVTGEKKQEDYYTSDHYETFDLVDFTC